MGLNLFSKISNALVYSGVSFYTEANGYVIYHTAVIIAALLILIIMTVLHQQKHASDIPLS